MSSHLADLIETTHVEPGTLAIFFIAQAGFVYKTPSGKRIAIDPYLSNCVTRLEGSRRYGFKRMIPTPIQAEELAVDVALSTHFHLDHLDIDAIPVLAQRPGLHFIGAPDCQAEYEKLGLPPERYTILHRGESLDYGEFQLRGVYADHGDLAPQALGVILQVGEITVWQTGDTGFRPDQWQDLLAQGVDVIIPPINGAYGNLNAHEAAHLAHLARARVAIPCHFWMFAEHGGDPAQFIEACQANAPHTQPLLMAPGERFIFQK
jgi:L-ascorbate 6-phosphate lactonase